MSEDARNIGNKEKLISKCCGAKVEYSKNYVLGALMGAEHFRCTRCGKDPCDVEEKRENLGGRMTDKRMFEVDKRGNATETKINSEQAQISAEEIDQDDPCVCCGGPSGEKKGTHISLRSCYVEGAGQLCKRCYDSVYGPKTF